MTVPLNLPDCDETLLSLAAGMDSPLPTPMSLHARPPFNKPFVSVALRSSDGVEFHALEGSLVDASPVFADMLSAPQASSVDGLDQDDTRADADTRQLRGVIELPETNDALRFLLPFCHNMAPDPPPSSFDEFKPAMRAWVKYGLRGDALERALDALEPFLLSEPLRAFALAAQLDEPKLMKLAARACLFLPNLWNIDVAELENISVNTYRRLLKYQDAAVSKVTELEGLACREFAFREPDGSSELFSGNAAQCTLARKPSEYDAGQCRRLLKKIASNPRSIQRAGAFGFPLELLFTGYCYYPSKYLIEEIPALMMVPDHIRTHLDKLDRELSEIPF